MRKTDTEYVTDAQLAAMRDQVAESWAAEYAREGSPYYISAMRRFQKEATDAKS